MLLGYFDESGTHDAGYVVTIAGYVATKEVWSEIEPRWREGLSLYSENNVKVFHATDCLAEPPRGEFSGIEQFYRHAMLLKLSQLLSLSEVNAVWSSIVMDDWKVLFDKQPYEESRRHPSIPLKTAGCELQTERFLSRFPKPYYLCFEHIMLQIRQWSKLCAGGENVALTFALHPEYTNEIKADTTGLYRHSANEGGGIGSFEWGLPSQIIPLQAADLISHEISEYWRKIEYDEVSYPFGPRRLLENATKFNGLTMGGCFDMPALENALMRFNLTERII